MSRSNRPGANLSRPGSSSSLHGSSHLEMSDPLSVTAASMNSEDEDSDGRGQSALSYKERRREAHTQAEQKRRDAIKKGYEYLQDLVPNLNEDGSPSTSGSAAKASKAVVLQKAIEHIQQVEGQKKKQEDDVNSLRKELASLQIIRDTYDELVKVHQTSTSGGGGEAGDDGVFIPSEVKFRVFQMLMDSLFLSFNEKVGMNNFQELSRCVISWLEEYCTPYVLQDLMLNILEQVKKEAQEGGSVTSASITNGSIRNQTSGPPNTCATDINE